MIGVKLGGCPWDTLQQSCLILVLTVLILAGQGPFSVLATQPPITDADQVEVLNDIIKSKEDKCSYRVVVLPNKLAALLVHEDGLDKAAAALDVHIGALSDPKEASGLAHFLEHLLFMGTKKYPEENDYSKFLSSHGGYSNASTGDEHTKYYFQVTADHLEPALDRFAQFFIEPLFNPGGVERELQAINSEHEKNILNDQWRISQVQKALANPDHPYSNFSTGNLETLKDVSREVVMDFYQQHYSANLMRLVVYGKESLDQLQQMVVSKFSAIPNTRLFSPIWSGQPLKPEHFQKIIHMRTLKEIRAIHLTWLLPDLKPFRKAKPEFYYSHLINHKGEGSIFSLLKQKGWATNLSAAADMSIAGFTFFRLVVSLSPEGLRNYKEIISIIFRYIKMLQHEGPKRQIYEEMRKRNKQRFTFMEKGQPASFCLLKAGNMHTYGYPYKDLLKGPNVVADYDPDLIKLIGDLLTPDNFRVILATSAPLEHPNPEREKWYGTEYWVEDCDQELLQQLKAPYQAIDNTTLHLPKPNPFIPENPHVKMNMNLMSETKKLRPDLLEDNERFKLWHKQDDTFAIPKGAVMLILRTPFSHNSVENFLKSYLSSELVQDSLKEYIYEAQVAGLSFLIGHDVNGVGITFYGYDEKLSSFIKVILNRIKNLTIDPIRFEVIKDKYKRQLDSYIQTAPSTLLSYYLNGILQEKNWWYWQEAAVLESIKYEHVQPFLPQLLRQGNLEILCHGNYFAEEARQISQMIWEELQPIPLPKSAIVGLCTIRLRQGQQIIFSPEPIPSKNSAIEIYLQIGSMEDLRLRTLSTLFAQIFKEPFYDQLRTKKQLGYLVQHAVQLKGVSFGLAFIIQSSRDPVELEGHIEEFLTATENTIKEMTNDQFNGHVASLSALFLEKSRRMSDETSIYWQQITRQQYEFEKNYTNAEYLQKLTKDDMLDFLQRYVLKDAPLRRKLSIHLWPETLAETRKQAYAQLSMDNVLFFSDPTRMNNLFEFFPSVYPIPLVANQAEQEQEEMQID